MTDDAKFWVTIIAVLFGGGFLGWLLGKIEQWWVKPRIVIEYGPDYPFVDTALFTTGEKGDFIRVRVKNKGRKTAARCKCYVRNITLKHRGAVKNLPSESLMLTSWVPREENVTIKNIPPHSAFFADVAYTMTVGSQFKVAPVFNIQNANVSEFHSHVGDFQLEFVVLGENFVPVSRPIKFSFDGKSHTLLPSA
jgi:hypothetical protein